MSSVPITLMLCCPAILHAQIAAAPSVVWSGREIGGAGLAGVWVQEKLSGTSSAAAGSILFANQINLDDTMDAGAGTTNLDALDVQDVVGPGARGSRNAIHGNVIVVARPVDHQRSTSFPAYVGGFFTASSAFPLGGRATSYALSAGELWGINPNVNAAPGATDLYGIVGAEIDVTAQPGSSMAQKLWLTVAQASASTVSGAQDDIAIDVINQGGAVGWRRGLAFGNTGAFWPIAASGTLIGAEPGQSGAGQARAALGIDLGVVAFSIASLRVPGLTIDGHGHPVTSGTIVTGASRAAVRECGAGAGIDGSDMAGTVTLGSGAGATCTLAFAQVWASTPHCVLTARGAATPGALSIVRDSPAAITVHAEAMPSFTYLCEG